MTVLHTNTMISSEVLDISEELGTAVHELAADHLQHQMLGRLAYTTLRSLERAPGVNTAAALLLADLITFWAVKEIARKNDLKLLDVQQGWTLALAFRYRLLPRPEVERSHDDKPAN